MYLSDHSPYYQDLFRTEGIDIQSISAANLDQIPFTTKTDIEKHNTAFEAINRKSIVEYVTTSGTLGEPISIALGQTDLERLAYNESQSLGLCGITDEDTILITTTLDKRFMAGMAYYLGATKIGATVIRSGIGDLHFQLDNLNRYRPTTLIAVPSFAHKLGLFLNTQNIDPANCSIKKIICIGEPIRNADLTPNTLHSKLTDLWNCPLFSTYASTEMATAFTECEHGNGGHLLPELMIVEVVDDEGKKVEDGDLGEVVATPLGIMGTPLLRYKTGDMARLYNEPCICGRNTPRLGPIEGRKKHLIKLKGTSVYPQQIENVLHQIDGINQYLLELSHNELDMDDLCIYLAITDDLNIETVSNQLSEQLRVRPQITFISDKEMSLKLKAHKSRKPSKLLDLRISNQ